jgi:hypothetical protein
MRPLSSRVKAAIDRDPFFRKCCLTGSPNPSMEHCWLYGGRQIDEVWAIVPLRGDWNTSHPPRTVKEKCRLVSLLRATSADLKRYPRADWLTTKQYLITKYPEFYIAKKKEYEGIDAV